MHDEDVMITEALSDVARFVVRGMNTVGGLSVSALAVLSALDSSGASRMTDLATQVGVSQPTMTLMVSRLAAQGLVERKADPRDRRIVLCGITDAGRKLLHDRNAGRLAFLAHLIHELEPEDRVALHSAAPALRRVVNRAAVPDALHAARSAMLEQAFPTAEIG